MKTLVFVYALLAFNSHALADGGTCLALGKVTDEDKVCAQYNDTDEATCKKANGKAFCAWQATVIRGTGPLRVTCIKDGVHKIYNVNTLAYDGVGTKSLTGINFGPNRGDEGFVDLKGSCYVRPNVIESPTPSGR
jgi:hypothetical protein